MTDRLPRLPRLPGTHVCAECWRFPCRCLNWGANGQNTYCSDPRNAFAIESPRMSDAEAATIGWTAAARLGLCAGEVIRVSHELSIDGVDEVHVDVTLEAWKRTAPTAVLETLLVDLPDYKSSQRLFFKAHGVTVHSFWTRADPITRRAAEDRR